MGIKGQTVAGCTGQNGQAKNWRQKNVGRANRTPFTDVFTFANAWRGQRDFQEPIAFVNGEDGLYSVEGAKAKALVRLSTIDGRVKVTVEDSDTQFGSVFVDFALVARLTTDRFNPNLKLDALGQHSQRQLHNMLREQYEVWQSEMEREKELRISDEKFQRFLGAVIPQAKTGVEAVLAIASGELGFYNLSHASDHVLFQLQEVKGEKRLYFTHSLVKEVEISKGAYMKLEILGMSYCPEFLRCSNACVREQMKFFWNYINEYATRHGIRKKVQVSTSARRAMLVA